MTNVLSEKSIIESALQISESDHNNKEKIKNKCNDIIANLGELNAYIFFKQSDFGDKLICNNDINAKVPTADYSYDFNGINVNIEVNTQQETKSNKKTTSISAGATKFKYRHNGQQVDITLDTTSCCPFGYDEDIILANVISKINKIKEDEKQFKENEINILFVDLSFLAPLNLLKYHEQPLVIDMNNDEYIIQCGSIWHSVYGNKDDILFDKIDINMPFETSVYKIPYKMKFYNKSKIDFIIFKNYEKFFIYQNPNRQNSLINTEFYRKIKSLKASVLWLNEDGRLQDKIKYYKDIIKYLLKFKELVS